MSDVQLLRPHPNTLWVQSDGSLPPWPDYLDEIPGVRYQEGPKGVRLTLPSTVWDLAPVRDYLYLFGWSAPRNASIAPADGLSDKLYAHQRIAAQFLIDNGGGLLGDEMGLGKSLTALASAYWLRCRSGTKRPILICGPKTVRGVWRNEIRKFDLPGRWVQLEGTRPDVECVRGADWIFCHYDIVKYWWSQINVRQPLVAVLDEAHLVKNGRTKRGKAAQLAASAAPHRILLTGTPVLNRIGEMWHLLSLVTGKWSWGSPLEFRIRYAGAMYTGHAYEDTQPTHQEELQTRLSHVYLRRTVQDVELNLPPLTRQVVEVDLDPKWATRYRDLFDGYDPQVVLNAVLHGNASTKTIKWLGRLRKIVSDAKLEATQLEVQTALEAGESVLVFAWQRRTVNRLARLFKDAAPGRAVLAVTGDVAQPARETAVDAFQKQGGLLCATLDSLNVGVTLTKARVCVMHDLDWVPAQMLQAERRFWRIGQTAPCISKWMVARDTMDEMIMTAFRRKAAMVEAGASDLSVRELSEVLSPQEANQWLTKLVAWAKEG